MLLKLCIHLNPSLWVGPVRSLTCGTNLNTWVLLHLLLAHIRSQAVLLSVVSQWMRNKQDVCERTITSLSQQMSSFNTCWEVKLNKHNETVSDSFFIIWTFSWAQQMLHMNLFLFSWSHFLPPLSHADSNRLCERSWWWDGSRTVNSPDAVLTPSCLNSSTVTMTLYSAEEPSLALN